MSPEGSDSRRLMKFVGTVTFQPTDLEESDRKFGGWMTVEVRDRQGDIIDPDGITAEEYIRIMGGPLLDMHKNKPIGRITKMEHRPKKLKDGKEAKGIYVEGHIFKPPKDSKMKDYPGWKSAWNEVTSSFRDGSPIGLSLGGDPEGTKIRCTSGECERVVPVTYLEEISLVRRSSRPANPESYLDSHNSLAKAENHVNSFLVMTPVSFNNIPVDEILEGINSLKKIYHNHVECCNVEKQLPHHVKEFRCDNCGTTTSVHKKLKAVTFGGQRFERKKKDKNLTEAVAKTLTKRLDNTMTDEELKDGDKAKDSDEVQLDGELKIARASAVKAMAKTLRKEAYNTWGSAPKSTVGPRQFRVEGFGSSPGAPRQIVDETQRMAYNPASAFDVRSLRDMLSGLGSLDDNGRAARLGQIRNQLQAAGIEPVSALRDAAALMNQPRESGFNDALWQRGQNPRATVSAQPQLYEVNQGHTATGQRDETPQFIQNQVARHQEESPMKELESFFSRDPGPVRTWPTPSTPPYHSNSFEGRPFPMGDQPDWEKLRREGGADNLQAEVATDSGRMNGGQDTREQVPGDREKLLRNSLSGYFSVPRTPGGAPHPSPNYLELLQQLQANPEGGHQVAGKLMEMSSKLGGIQNLFDATKRHEVLSRAVAEGRMSSEQASQIMREARHMMGEIQGRDVFDRGNGAQTRPAGEDFWNDVKGSSEGVDRSEGNYGSMIERLQDIYGNDMDRGAKDQFFGAADGTPRFQLGGLGGAVERQLFGSPKDSAYSERVNRDLGANNMMAPGLSPADIKPVSTKPYPSELSHLLSRLEGTAAPLSETVAVPDKENGGFDVNRNAMDPRKAGVQGVDANGRPMPFVPRPQMRNQDGSLSDSSFVPKKQVNTSIGEGVRNHIENTSGPAPDPNAPHKPIGSHEADRSRPTIPTPTADQGGARLAAIRALKQKLEQGQNFSPEDKDLFEQLRSGQEAMQHNFSRLEPVSAASEGNANTAGNVSESALDVMNRLAGGQNFKGEREARSDRAYDAYIGSSEGGEDKLLPVPKDAFNVPEDTVSYNLRDKFGRERTESAPVRADTPDRAFKDEKRNVGPRTQEETLPYIEQGTANPYDWLGVPPEKQPKSIDAQEALLRQKEQGHNTRPARMEAGFNSMDAELRGSAGSDRKLNSGQTVHPLEIASDSANTGKNPTGSFGVGHTPSKPEPPKKSPIGERLESAARGAASHGIHGAEQKRAQEAVRTVNHRINSYSEKPALHTAQSFPPVGAQTARIENRSQKPKFWSGFADMTKSESALMKVLKKRLDEME